MVKRSHILIIVLICFVITSCSIIGIHFKIHNPKRAGKYRHDDNKATWLLGTMTKYRSCFDVKYNRIQLNINPEKKFITGTVTTTAVATADIDTFQIDLYRNMKVKKIYLGSDEPKYYRKEGAIFIIPSQKISAGTTFTVQTQYEGSPVTARKPPWDGGFVWKKDKNDQPWIGVACESEGASLWWPCKDHNSDEADSTFISLTVPKGLVGVANGHLIDSVNLKDSTTFNWMVHYPINNYNVSVYVGKFKLLHETYTSPLTGKDIPFNHYVLGYNYDIAKKHLQQAKNIVAFFEKQFGEYPWPKDGYKLVESPYEGMEHQTAIAYGAGYKNSYNDDFDYIILHETAHEWWGNSITVADLADVWLQEGMATYAEALYVEAKYGKDEAIQYLGTYRISIINRRPLVGPVGRRWFWHKDGDVYVKGAWMMHTLRTVIGNDKLFFDILKSFREKYHGVTISSHDFIAYVNERTGNDYTWFFNQYLHNRFTPILEYYMEGNKFYYRWTHVNEDFRMPVNIQANGDDENIRIVPSAKTQVLEYRTAFRSLYLPEERMLFGVKENAKLRKMK
jgi:aminopeptidase N